jgi:NAD+--asparagine ADP-ribosyltransferase
VKKAINGVWCGDGKNWSDRIWSNKTLLQERIREGVVDSIASGMSKD